MEILTVNQILEKVKAFLQKTYQDNLDKVILFGSRAILNLQLLGLIIVCFI